MKEREIVINDDFGGFSLSHEAFLLLKKYKQKDALEEPDIGEYWKDGSGPREKFLEGFCREIPRDDPYLVKVVKELGKKANGLCADLKIVKIPADVEWTIEEYDGSEWIAEKHRIWGRDD